MNTEQAVDIYTKFTQANTQVIIDSLISLSQTDSDFFIQWIDSVENNTFIKQKEEKEIELAKVQAELSAIEVKIK